MQFDQHDHLAALGGTAASVDPERAARLFAASSALLASIGVPLAPVDQAALARDLEAARKRLGAAAWERAWAEGLALSGEEAVALALAGDDPPADAAVREAGADRLSPREREVSRLIAQRLTNRQIARAGPASSTWPTSTGAAPPDSPTPPTT